MRAGVKQGIRVFMVETRLPWARPGGDMPGAAGVDERGTEELREPRGPKDGMELLQAIKLGVTRS